MPLGVGDVGPVERALDTTQQGIAKVCRLFDCSQSLVQAFRPRRPWRGPELDESGLHLRNPEIDSSLSAGARTPFGAYLAVAAQVD